MWCPSADCISRCFGVYIASEEVISMDFQAFEKLIMSNKHPVILIEGKRKMLFKGVKRDIMYKILLMV